MLTLPSDIITLMAVFAPLFSPTVLEHAQVLLTGAILTPEAVRSVRNRDEVTPHTDLHQSLLEPQRLLVEYALIRCAVDQ